MKVIEISKSPEESIVIGKKLASMAKAGDTFALIGDLGTGKTLLSKGIALGL
jgi:tRNA threonylcarbamoyladenosine biosynthesis protein TsaE